MCTKIDLSEFAPKYPREAIAPAFERTPESLTVSGQGRREVFGYYAHRIAVVPGVRYRFCVRFRAKDVENIAISAMAMLLWITDGRGEEGCPHDAIMRYSTDGDVITAEDAFTAPPGADQVEIELGLRFSGGSLSFLSAELEETEPLAARPVRISVCKWSYDDGLTKTLNDNTRALTKLLDEAGAAQSDLFLLPEFATAYEGARICDVAEELDENLSSRSLSLFREKAVQYGMYVCAGIIERENEILYNTAVLIDRKGALVGKYRKTHPYWPEEMFSGIMPGDQYPIFDLDFGRVGIMICYDSWFSETARLYALKGAELLLFPNAGYEPLLMPARAIDNSMYVAISSLYMESAIYNTTGQKACMTQKGVLTAPLDLSRRALPHANAGGNLNGSPGGKRGMHHSVSMELYRLVAEEAETSMDRPAPYTWL